MNVTFYFDLSCPYSWITSRWLLQVSAQRDINITWKPFCLAIKNNELEVEPSEGKNAQAHRDALRALRVLMAAHQQHGTTLIDGYTAAGMVRHILGEALDDQGIESMLRDQLQLPVELASHADDTTYDDQFQANIDEAVAVAGKNIGVPTIVYELADGTKQGYFGPVLSELPALDQSLDIWDGLAKLATVSSFYELKRDRSGSGGPDVASTARC